MPELPATLPAAGQWTPLKAGPVAIHVVDGHSGAAVCQVPAWACDKGRVLMGRITRAQSVPGMRMRLIWAGQPLAKGSLPRELMVGDNRAVKLLDVDPDWQEPLNQLMDGLPVKRTSAPRSDEALLSNRSFVLAAVREAGGALRMAAEELRRDREVVLAAVQENGDALRFAAEELRSDRDVVLAAVRGNGAALEFATEALRSDPEVVAAAVAECGEAFRFASEALRRDWGVALATVTACSGALRHVHPELLLDRNFLYAVTRANASALLHAPEEIRRDRGLVLTARAQRVGAGDRPSRSFAGGRRCATQLVCGGRQAPVASATW